MAAHRYWRILVSANNGDESFCNCGEIEMFISGSGVDQCTGGTPSASSLQSGFTAAMGFDNNSATAIAFNTWSSNRPGWVKYDFGSGVTKDIISIRLTMFTTGHHTQMWRNWEVQWSDDNTNWTTAWSNTNSIEWDQGEARTFDATGWTDKPALKTRWRIKSTTATASDRLSINKIEFSLAGTFSDECSGGSAFASTLGEGSIANAFDSNDGTYWGSVNWTNGTREWLGYTFASAKNITQVRIKVRNDAWYTQGPKGFALQYCDGNGGWVTLAGFAATWSSANQQQTFDSASASTTLRYWRLHVYRIASGTGGPRIADLQLRSTAGGADQTGSGTASHSSALAGADGSNAFDSLASTWWEPTGVNSWVKYDLGSSISITEMALAITVDPSKAPADFLLEGSADDSNWAPFVEVFALTSWTYGERKTFNQAGITATPSVGSAARYWRTLVTALDGGSTPTVAEFKLYGSTGSNLVGSGTGFSGIVNAGGEASKAFDANSATAWAANGSGPEHWWIGYDFGSNATPISISLQAPSSTPSNAPKDFRLQKSDDGLGWQTDFSLAGMSGWTTGQTRYFDSTGEIGAPTVTVTARPVVFICT